MACDFISNIWFKHYNIMNNIFKLIISIAIPLAIGAMGSYFTVREIGGWYQLINKPTWNPLTGYLARCGRLYIY